MRQVALIAVKLLVSAALLYFASTRIDTAMIGERLNRLAPGWIAAAVAIAVLQTGLLALRWQRIAFLCGAAMPFRQAFRFSLIAVFFNQVLPSTVGGDAARLMFLARTGAGWWKAACSVLLDRFVGVLMLAMLVAAGLPWSFGLIESPIGRVVLVLIGLGSIVGAAAFLALGSWQSLARWRPTRRLAELSGLARRVLFSRGPSPPIVLASLIVHLMTAAMAWSVAAAVAAPMGLAHALLLVLPVMLIATVPISIAGWGVRESALVLAFSYAGLAESDGLIVSVLLGGVMFAVGCIGGLTGLAGSDRLTAAGTAPGNRG
jgi:uncharacterized membrane protein YbhN (UPF0104 family)